MSSFLTPQQLDLKAQSILKELEGKSLTPRDRLAIEQQEMPQQDPETRNSNMQEVALGYSEAQLKVETMRCLQCKTAPCISGCPVNLNIPAFIQAAYEGDYQGALSIIHQDSLLPAICGRVCPQERQCMAKCTVGKSLRDPMKAVAIGRIERFIADHTAEENQPIKIKLKTGKKVAIVGGGPSGLTAAAELVKAGHEIHLFEAFHKVGGVTVYGIPEFRLPKKIVQKEVDTLIEMGVTIHTNFLVGRTQKLLSLIEEGGFDAAYIATGAGLPIFMNIEGENSIGVFSANEYLTRSNLMKAYAKKEADTPAYPTETIVVVGGGNVAMDAARTAKRMGAKRVLLVYRRTKAEMPARAEEIEHALEEGVEMLNLVNPTRILADEKGKVKAIECQRYQLGEIDSSGRASSTPIENSEFQIETEAVIIAIGNSSNPLIHQTTEGLEWTPKGTLIVNEKMQSANEKIYAGGDIVQGAATVILAMGDGKRAAQAINEQLQS